MWNTNFCMIKDTLISIGLTDKESEVYLDLLEMGSTSTGKIIEKGKVSRSKVYDVLGRLKEKGFVTEIIKNGVRHFEVTPASRIVDYLNIEKDKISSQLVEAESLAKEIEKGLKKVSPDEAKIYTGLKAVRGLFSDLLRNLDSKDEYLAITVGSIKWNKEMELFFQSFHLKRAQKKISAKVLYAGDISHMPNSVNLKHTGHYEFRTTSISVPSGIIICGDKVGTIVWGEEPKVFVIISKENAEQYRKFFYDVWKSAKK